MLDHLNYFLKITDRKLWSRAKFLPFSTLHKKVRQMNSRKAADVSEMGVFGEDMEPHFNIQEIARALEISEELARRIFEKEEGVLRIGNEMSIKGRRRYLTLRVPRSVFRRVYARLQQRTTVRSR
jgi:hypothetical protein